LLDYVANRVVVLLANFGSAAANHNLKQDFIEF
jgi:hypothetical protein